MLREFLCVGLFAQYMRWQKIDISCSQFFQITRNKLIIKPGLSMLTVQRCEGYIVELCCQVSVWSRSFQHICWWESYEFTLLILIIDLTLKKQSRHVFTKSQASFYIKFSNFSERILWRWVIRLAVAQLMAIFHWRVLGKARFGLCTIT